MPKKHRITFIINDELYERAQKLPWSARSAILRVFMIRVLEVVEKRGSMILGALINGEYELVPRKEPEDESS
jgi:hypothetical protein